MTQTGETLPQLMVIMRRLLAPDGCPWDREQTLESLRPFVIEEAHEVVDAIDKHDLPNLREELGDLLLQIVFQSALVEDKLGGAFGIDDVIAGICNKMTRRHPHVFGDETAADSKAVLERWEQLKAKEKSGRGVLDGVPRSMPALLRALRVGEKAGQIGLDWPDARGPREKLDEELRELDEAVANGDRTEMESELGDVLFSVVSIARKHGLDPEAALRGTVDRFSARTSHVEQTLRARELDGRTQSAEQLDALWAEAKEALKRAGT
ncbi:MAG: Nucleoside triphosphate pyrophosphohydrolase MazG [Myxococcaceae bacterium]|nr:Nucleoside triphosphate pyrophosphohydrolase MazG [Myxococcaceae bacterium]